MANAAKFAPGKGCARLQAHGQEFNKTDCLFYRTFSKDKSMSIYFTFFYLWSNEKPTRSLSKASEAIFFFSKNNLCCKTKEELENYIRFIFTIDNNKNVIKIFNG